MNKKIFKQLFFLCSIAGILCSCMVEDILHPTKTGNISPEVLEAKNWYDSQETRDGIRLTNPDSSAEPPLIPDWRMAFSNEDNEYKMVEVYLTGKKILQKIDEETGAVLESKEYFTISCEECGKKYEETGDRRYLAYNIRMIVRQNKATGDRDGFIMIAIPDLPYLERNLDNPFQYFNYLERNNDNFIGTIQYYHLNGTWSNGWRYKDGKIYSLHPSIKEEKSIK